LAVKTKDKLNKSLIFNPQTGYLEGFHKIK